MATDRFNGVVASLAIKVRCVVGAEANVATLAGAQTIESIPVVLGDRVLLTAQTDPILNGAWDVQDPGPWTRAADWDGNRDIEKGSTVWAGKTGQDDQLWQVQTAGIIVPGNTAVTISLLFNPASPLSASLQEVTDVGAISTNSIHLNGGSLLLTESTLQPEVSVATIGQIWVRDDAPNVLMFTDDIGGDYQLSSIAGVLPVGTVVDSSLVWADPNWLENTGILLGSNNIKILESAAGAADTATYGQFWVRNDVEQTPMFTDEAGVDYELNAAGGTTVDTFNYQFSTSLTMSNPGAGFVRLNSATPASVTLCVFSDTDFDGNDLNADMVRLDRYYVMTIRDPADPTRFVRYAMTSNPSDSGGYFAPGLSYIEGTTMPIDNAEVTIQFRNVPHLGSGFVTTGTILTYNLVTCQYEALDGDWRLTNDGTDSILHSNSNLRLQSSFNLKINQELHIEEQAAAVSSVALYGQLWVRDDVPNTLMFTDDTGVDYELAGAGVPTPISLDLYNYQFDTSLVQTDPGAGFLRLSHAAPASVIQLMISETTSLGVDIGADIFAKIVRGWVLRIVDPNDLTSFLVYTIRDFIDFGAYVRLDVSYVSGTLVTSDNAPIFVELRQSPYFETLEVPGGASGGVPVWDNVTGQFGHSGSRGTITEPGVGITLIGTSDSALELGSASQVRTDSTFNAAYVDNTKAITLWSDGGELTIQTGSAGGPLHLKGGVGDDTVRIGSGSTLTFDEIGAALADVLSVGQVWVRNDAPNTLMFTDDVGNDYVIGGGLAPSPFVIDQYNYTFDTRILQTDPGAGVFNFQSATPASINRLIISDIDANGVTIDTDIFTKIAEGWVCRVVDPADLTVIMEFTFDSTFDSTGFWIQNIVYVSGATLPANGASVILQLTANPLLDITTNLSQAGSLMAYDDASNTFISSATRGQLTQPSVGETRLSTSDSVLRLDSASRVQSSQSMYLSYLSNTDALIMGADGGHYSIGTGATSNKNLDLWADNGGQTVRIKGGSTLMIAETANAHADIATYGQFWTRDDAPGQTPMWTGDDGVDHILNAAAGGSPFATPLVVDGDINTGTPPTTEAVTSELVLRDLADNDDLASIGFAASNTLRIDNHMEGGLVQFRAVNTTGTVRSFLIANPNVGGDTFLTGIDQCGIKVGVSTSAVIATNGGSVSIWHAGSIAFETDVAGLYTVLGSVYMEEKAAAGADTIGRGQFWVRNDATQTPMFTDESGVDTALNAGTGDVTASGTPLNNQIAVFTGATDIDSNANFTYDGTVVDFTATVTAGFSIKGPSSQLRVHDSVSTGDSADYLSLDVQDDIGFIGGTDVSGAGFKGIANIDFVTGVVRLGNSGAEIILNNHTRLEDNVQLRFGTLAGGDVIIDWDGVDFEFQAAAANPTMNLRDGFHLRLWDSGDADWFDIHNNGTNLIITESGLAQITFPAAGTFALDMTDNIINTAILQDYAIESSPDDVSGTTVTFAYSDGPVFECDMEAATGNVTATLSGGPPAGTYGQITAKMTQDTTVRTLSWAGGTFRWAGGVAHPVTTTANGFSIYTFETWDGGAVWYASGADYS